MTEPSTAPEPTIPPEPLSEATLEQIATAATEDDAEHTLTGNEVAAVIAAYRNIVELGDPVGTIRRDLDTGAIALRAVDSVSGLTLWKVSCPDGTTYNSTEPTLNWPKLTP